MFVISSCQTSHGSILLTHFKPKKDKKNNQKKKPMRSYTKNYIKNEIRDILNIKHELKEIASIKEQKFKNFTENFNFFKEFLEEANIIEENKMADLSLKLAMKIIPLFNASPKGVTPFLKCIKLVHKTLKMY